MKTLVLTDVKKRFSDEYNNYNLLGDTLNKENKSVLSCEHNLFIPLFRRVEMLEQKNVVLLTDYTIEIECARYIMYEMNR